MFYNTKKSKSFRKFVWIKKKKMCKFYSDFGKNLGELQDILKYKILGFREKRPHQHFFFF